MSRIEECVYIAMMDYTNMLQNIVGSSIQCINLYLKARHCMKRYIFLQSFMFIYVVRRQLFPFKKQTSILVIERLVLCAQ